jgi:CubicO group peptidase (beta-lactamase class C family)
MLPTSSCGTRLSVVAIGHTGFTGTSLWIDPAQDLYIVLLTNRVHPTRDNNAIQPVRRAVHDAVASTVNG